MEHHTCFSPRKCLLPQLPDLAYSSSWLYPWTSSHLSPEWVLSVLRHPDCMLISLALKASSLIICLSQNPYNCSSAQFWQILRFLFVCLLVVFLAFEILTVGLYLWIPAQGLGPTTNGYTSFILTSCWPRFVNIKRIGNPHYCISHSSHSINSLYLLPARCWNFTYHTKANLRLRMRRWETGIL